VTNRPSIFGYHIAQFTTADGGRADFSNVIEQARAADEGGFDRIHVMDHLYQLTPAGHPHDPMFESYTTLAALAQHATNVDVAALVTGNPYRQPAMLAKIVTTLDHATGGRAQLGIGAGWYQAEHEAFGFEFDDDRTRLDRLDESLQIVSHMIAPDASPLTFTGRHYRTVEVVNSPPPTRRIPIIVGGDGERRTLRMAARFADESNLLCPVDQIPRKLDVIDKHCAEVGRPRSELAVTHLTRVMVAPTAEAAESEFLAAAEARAMPPQALEVARSFLTIGGPDEVGEELQRRLDLGLDGLTISLNANGHDPERVGLLANIVEQLR
jgi:F420-dependent oxidoreductase-like protein